MPKKKTAKIRRHATIRAAPRHRPAAVFKSSSSFKRKAPKINRPDIHVKKAAYSKAARAAVLSSAAARQRLIDMGGENTIDIIREFDKDMSDEELARKTGIKASDVRVVLNRLHSEGLFSYTRVRDKDSGWYSYIWKMSEGRLKEFVADFGPVEGGETTEIMEGDAYRCPACSPEKLVSFEEASDSQFRCGACGSSLEFFERKDAARKL